MQVYLYIVAAVIIFGQIMPQRGRNRKYYIIFMAAIHTFVCAFRYQFLTGDLMKYHTEYTTVVNYGWFSDTVLREGKNTGFYMLMKLISGWTSGDFQVFLILLAVFTEICVAYIIYKYSPIPWLSYLVWNCMAFYVFGFTSIKQALAMSVLMIAFHYIIQEKPVKYLLFALLAAFIHMPALVFLPAYWIVKIRFREISLVVYFIVGALVYMLRSPLVTFITDIYYEEEEFVLQESGLGGRFFMIVAILLAGLALKGFREKNFSKVFNIIVVAAILQMLSGYDNVFTRMTDYYFQFSILFIPMIFSNYAINTKIDTSGVRAIFPFDNRSLKFFIIIVSIILIWFYYNYYLGVEIAVAVDDYTNFRFMWDVIS